MIEMELRLSWKSLSRRTRVLFSIGLGISTFFLICALFSEWIAPYDPYEVMSNRRLLPPSTEHIMGTDGVGRDVFSRVVYGVRVSLAIAGVAVSIAGGVGIIIGPICGYFGGIVDRVFSIVMDSLHAFPSLILALTISVFLGPGLINTGIAISCSFIPFFFKVIRSVSITCKGKLFIDSAMVDGGTKLYVLRRHVIPRCLATTLVLASMGIVTSIITAASLGFLGYGVQPPTAEWGLDISIARTTLMSGIWWPTIFPGLFIFISICGFDLLSTSLGEIERKL